MFFITVISQLIDITYIAMRIFKYDMIIVKKDNRRGEEKLIMRIIFHNLP